MAFFVTHFTSNCEPAEKTNSLLWCWCS